ncbi:hypothetical protein AURDEDRAFT_117081 [Auricularia subglabra TFB-10046 SS5]|uniref:RING-type domain-containing protein n=1 Tax=Auricularia subglabra (strain TFB-10046 / SS5) TaxID=717982 RepID=J0CYU5_AURST|nr:hypothetical protein AURDEDRAFT_117081 [Auricularia subglabra TFB-10046 SS5]
MEKQYDLLIITDATGSMGSYLTALGTSIPEILALTRLSGLFSRIGILSYYDYCDNEVIRWSGWDKDPKDLLDFVSSLRPTGGGDWPEAAKTAMIRAMQYADYMDKDKETIVLFYTDAPPHHAQYGGDNMKAEAKAFKDGATDWVTITFAAKARHMRVFSFVASGMQDTEQRFYAFLSQATGGLCMTTQQSSQAISRLTIDVLLHWMGAVEPSAPPYAHNSKTLAFVVAPQDARPKPKDEGRNCQGYLPPARGAGNVVDPVPLVRHALQPAQDITRAELDARFVALAKRFANPEEAAYRATVYSTLREIIDTNVFSLTYNAVFGQLWRAVCREQTPEKEDIVMAFGAAVGKIADKTLREGMTAWLEASYDSSAEIEEMVKKAGEGGQWMYLDLDAQVEMTRVELLEASRSYHRGVLKKLASVFTHAKLVEPGTVLTEHQRAIPLNLPPRQIFRLLPHLVVPGTLYSSRASAVMAILALQVGVPFLAEAATTVAGYTKDTWLDLEHPETVSWECASFVLNAPDPALCLTPAERATYAGMRRYRLLELNLDAALSARVPWTPEKARGVGDVRVRCALCGMMRSTTIMSNDMRGVCGYCVSYALVGGDPKPQDVPGCEPMESCWVECGVRTCRAQYVVENPAALNVRPKCWYCRNNTPCPFLECSSCTNRVVVPKKYAPADAKHYKCPACASGARAAVAEAETTARALCDENGVGWLGVPDIADATFKGHSAFKLYKAHGDAPFAAVEPDTKAGLTLRAKRVLDPTAVRAQLDARVGRGAVARRTCALCFDEFAPDRVGPACGRSGCAQRVCGRCLQEWYGRNAPGTLLNAMELACPFCRRVPVAKIVLRTNPDVGGLKGIKDALADRAWFYAWCGQCSTAKRAVERVCTVDGRLPEIREFVCEECQDANARELERLEEERRQLEALARHLFADEDGAARRLRDVQRRLERAKENKSTKTMPCPRCTILVEKMYGCDHITCHCGAHWCWVCGKESDERNIYAHLNKAHGGFYNDPLDAEGYDSD